MFAYSNALRRLKTAPAESKQQPAGNGYGVALTPSPAPSASPVTPFQTMKAEFKSVVDNAPAKIASEFNQAQNARQQFYSKAADKLDSIQGDLNQAKADKTYRAELREGEKAFSDTPLDKPRPAIAENIPAMPEKPQRLSVDATVKQIQRDVKASGSTSPEDVQAAVFDAFAAMPNPAPLNDAILQRIADKLVINRAHTAPSTAPAHAPHARVGGVHAPHTQDNTQPVLHASNEPDTQPVLHAPHARVGGAEGRFEVGSIEAYDAADSAAVGSTVGCPQCGADFVKKNQQHRFCCKEHRFAWHNDRDPKRQEFMENRKSKAA